MARTKPWEVSDEVWERVRPLIPAAPSHAKGGRRRMDDRKAFEALVYVLRTGIQWEWQAVDGVMTKAPFGRAATGANPTDRGKCGTKRSVLTDGAGIPLALVVDGANRHDVRLSSATLDGLVISRSEPTPEQLPSRLCSTHLC